LARVSASFEGDRISTSTTGSESARPMEGGAQVIPMSGMSMFRSERMRGMTPGVVTARQRLPLARRWAVMR